MLGKEIESVKVVQVIEIISTRGVGTDADPVRRVKSYWTLDNPSEKIAEFDPVNEDLLKMKKSLGIRKKLNDFTVSPCSGDGSYYCDEPSIKNPSVED